MNTPNQTLLNETKRLLEERKGEWPDIGRDTGLGYQWISKVMQGRIKDPGVNKVEKIYRHLRQLPTPLERELAVVNQ